MEAISMTSSLSRPLSREEVAAFGAKLDELRNRVLAALGEDDARYVRRVRDAVRWSELGGRALLFAGILPPAWVLGTLLLGLSKILENMELGHNVMHGQYDWMQDPEFHSQTYDWDNACAAPAWRHSHNYMHHKFTNVVGRDRDVGYGFLRLFPDQPWHPAHLLQPPASLLLALGFQWGVALHDLELEREPRANLRHQIAHLLFTDVPANRSAEMAVEVKRIAGEYGQHYNTGSFARQFASVVKRIVRYALPNTTPVRRTVDLLVERVGLSPRVEAWWAWRSGLRATHQPSAPGRAAVACRRAGRRSSPCPSARAGRRA